MKKALVTAGAVLLTLSLVAPAEARRHRAAAAENDGWSEEVRARTSEQRSFWEDEDSSERLARRGRRAQAAEVSDDNSDERPARRGRRAHASAENVFDSEDTPRRQRRSRSNDEGSSEERSYPVTSSEGVGPRPGAWCGWYMRTRHGGSSEYNLAWNWSRRGTALSGPQVGAIVVWPHHVGEITGQTSDGKWIVLSGNDSGQVKERARSVSGAVFRSL